MLYSELFSKSFKQIGNGKDNETTALNIQLLMEKAFHLTRTEFWINKNEEITDKNAVKRFHRLMKRLEKKEPVAYILKQKQFYGETFYIDRNVLIPRPETEILVEKAIRSVSAPLEILDIGAGSGVISITLALLTGSHVTAVDTCKKALAVLKKNIALHGIENRVTPVRADLFPKGKNRFDMIVSNPPYIPEPEWEELDPSVRDYEPKLALTAGSDGLTFIRRIAQNARRYLKPGGKALMEFGYNQKEQVEEIMVNAGFTSIEFIEDYSRIPRVVIGKSNV